MAAPQGLAHFPGLSVIKGADLTVGHGITPSVCTIRTVPHTKFLPEFGNLTFTFGGKEVLRFRDCILDRASLRVSPDGYVWTLNILDRRWKWRYGRISGWYNKRLPDNTVDPDVEKTPRELAALLLDEMGEQGYSTVGLPPDPRPEVRWAAANPAQELARLCDELGCRIVLGLDDRVKIVRIGQGKKLPAGAVIASGFGVQNALAPDSIHVILGPTKWQAGFLLEAVGRDTDGSIKLLDDLSYKPDAGWGDPTFLGDGDLDGTYTEDGEERNIRDLAAATVFRWYRPKELIGGGLTPAKWPRRITKLEDLLPFDSVLLDTRTNPDGSEEGKPPLVAGTFFNWGEATENSDPGAVYKGSFSINPRTGIVQFSEPMTKLDGDGNHIAATLYLFVAFSVTNENTGQKAQGDLQRILRRGRRARNTGPLVIHHPEIERKIIQRYRNARPAKVEDNEVDVRAEATHYLDAAEAELDVEPSDYAEYGGIVAIEPDGAIQQVSWRVGDGQAAVTRASRNMEQNPFVLSYREKRRIEEADRARAKERAKGEVV